MENDVVAKYQAILAKGLEKWPMVEIGEYLQETNNTNEQLFFSIGDVRGISIAKKLIETKADMTGVSLKTYKIVASEEFVFVSVTSRNGEKISLAFNDEGASRIVSSTYVTFRSDNLNLLPEYLFLQFKRPEFDRYARFNSWGSAREIFTWEDMCRVKIPLPPLEVQRAYVKAYQGLTTLIEQNEALVKELEKTAQACIVECREKWPMVAVGDYISNFERKNSNCCDYPFMGINKEKEIVPTSANIEDVNPRKYLILEKGELVFSGMQTGRDICIRIALSKFDFPVLLSPAYTTFTVDERKGIISEYLFLNFKSNEMNRLGWFKSDSSVRANLDWGRFCEIKIPLPPLEVQRAIVALYTCAEEARKIASEARELLKKACPAMVQSAAHHKVGMFQ